METGAYGKRLAAAFRLLDAPTLVSKRTRDGFVAFTSLEVGSDTTFRSSILRPEDAYLVLLMLTPHPALQIFEDGRPAPATSISVGEIVILDLKRGPTLQIDRPLRMLAFYVPRQVLDEVAMNPMLPAWRSLSARRVPQYATRRSKVSSRR